MLNLVRPHTSPEARARQPDRLGAKQLAVLGHELRNPLAAVSALTELLAHKPLDADTANLVQLIRLATTQAIGVAENFVTDGALSAGRLRLNPTDVEPAAMAREVAGLFAPVLQLNGRAIHVEIARGTPKTIVTDPVRLRQVLLNLVSNAIKASADGNITLRVTKAPKRMRIAFEVEDTGPGLPDDFAIVPFQASANPTGTGLGLWISSSISKALGGGLEFGSADSGGTIARLSIHRALDRLLGRKTQRQGKPAEPAPADADDISAADADGPLKALVVDDSPVACMLMTAILESFGITALLAASGEEALTQLETEQPDVIFMDWALRQETGEDVINLLADSCGGTLPPVIVTSASEQVPYNPHVKAFLRKPFTPRELYALLEDVLSADGRSVLAG
ncbi:hybrid sensor histidine kinase/response regulator [Oryzibacter oryziterrae]|uniref:hybrid sensor histidine kinase/response regulator n=1 Tax=Oryzibacter oryziterrae TaxID=2766474 RepID=UPI001F47E0E0|nr:hybrid sensor histidine kinase/response regulator [Oryzibacter oryziterrae]